MQRQLVGLTCALAVMGVLVQSCSSQTYLGHGFEQGGDGGDGVFVEPTADAGSDVDVPTGPLCPSSACSHPFETCASSQHLCDTDLESDTNNCGACGNACPNEPWFENELHLKYICVKGECVRSCLNPFFPRWAVGDCNGVVEDGCETDLTKAENCGACGNACSPEARCKPTDDTGALYGCVTCASNEISCNETCIDPSGDDANCGACGHDCGSEPPPADAGAPPDNMYFGCDKRECGHLKCRKGFADCNGDRGDGCEVQIGVDSKSCEGCGLDCAPDQVCSSGVCVCQSEFGTCNCMTSFDSDPYNCGACGNTCPNSYDPSANGKASCKAGHCSFDCNAGYGDCNHDTNDGCETYLRIDPLNCGACGVACASGQACVEGSCATKPCESTGGTQ